MKVADIVEDFTAENQNGDSISLGEMLESGPVVLYFYIKAKTPG